MSTFIVQHHVLPDMDTEMRQLANSTIAKLEQMTDADFDGQRFDFTGE
mgnify:FL=1